MSQEEVRKYIEKNLYLEDVCQLYYKAVDKKLFIVYVDTGDQRDHWNANWEWLPFSFNIEHDHDCFWDSDISMAITPEQEAASLNGHKDWPESFPTLREMSKYIEDDISDNDKLSMLEEWRNKRLSAIKKLNEEFPPKELSDDMSPAELRRIAEYYAGYETDIIAIDRALDAVDAPHDCEESVSLAPKRIRLLGEQLQSASVKLEEYDSLITKIRNILTQAGIPDHESYPDEDVDDYEKSLRAGGRMIPLVERVRMLAGKACQ
jgi:hypothetical protein